MICGRCRGAASRATADRNRIVTVMSSYVNSGFAALRLMTETIRCQRLRRQMSLQYLAKLGETSESDGEVQDGWDKVPP